MGYNHTNGTINACVSYWYLLRIQRVYGAYSCALRSSPVQTELWMILSWEKHRCDCTESTHTSTTDTCVFPITIPRRCRYPGCLTLSCRTFNSGYSGGEWNKEWTSVLISIIFHAISYENLKPNLHISAILLSITYLFNRYLSNEF